MTSEVLDSIEKQLESLEYRQAFGSETIKYDLASALVKARNQAELSQEKLANLLNVSQAYIAKLESGNANPTIGHVGALLATMWLRTKFKLERLTRTIETKWGSTLEAKPVADASRFWSTLPWPLSSTGTAHAGEFAIPSIPDESGEANACLAGVTR